MLGSFFVLLKPVDLMQEGHQLKAQRARIGLVGDQEFQYEIRLQYGCISRSIGNGTVRNVQQHLKTRLELGRCRLQAAPQQFGSLERPLHAPSDFEKAPAETA